MAMNFTYEWSKDKVRRYGKLLSEANQVVPDCESWVTMVSAFFSELSAIGEEIPDNLGY